MHRVGCIGKVVVERKVCVEDLRSAYAVLSHGAIRRTQTPTERFLPRRRGGHGEFSFGGAEFMN